MTPTEFIARWEGSGGAELANSQSFLKELCELLGVAQPDPTEADESQNVYVFEKAVELNNGDGTTSSGRVDLYRRGSFVLESKQGSERKAAEQARALAEVTKAKRFRTGTARRGTPGWQQAMVKARGQAKGYAEALPEWPPFLIVVDVGYCIDLYADFAQAGKNYVPFPDPQTFRLELARLNSADVRELLAKIWLDPLALDPARQSAKVTRELAGKLALLAKRLEGLTDDAGQKRYTPDAVAQFLMRCLFTMFAEDVPLLGDPQAKKFTKLLESLRDEPDNFVPLVEDLWDKMNTGGFSSVFRQHLRKFNGGLFEDCTALPLDRDGLELLIEAAHAQWNEVEPAIFGTLLERALDPHERHKLGAHFTPRAYVERLVMPTVIEPLREQWDDAYAAAAAHIEEAEEKLAQAQIDADKLHDAKKVSQASSLLKRADGDARRLRRQARSVVADYHKHLCQVKVLDPACGSGNFLYVSLELMKRLEGEVLHAFRQFGDETTVLPAATIDPHQFLGIEINPRAAAIADLVLWIGYLQWHFRTRGSEPPVEPIIRKFHNIECRDAVLAWDDVEPVVDDDGKPVTRWDGRTTKPHPVTGEEVPDETARVQEMRYVNPRKAEWPEADFVVGNPPFVGNKRMNLALGDGYTATIRATITGVPGSADYVMYWWHLAAESVKAGRHQRFGFITTNSVTQAFNRQVLQRHLEDGSQFSIVFAIPDHPWVDSADGAAVRVAMTVGAMAENAGRLRKVIREGAPENGAIPVDVAESVGTIGSSLSIRLDHSSALELQSTEGLAFTGMYPLGQGFVVPSADVPSVIGTDTDRTVLKPYRTARDLAQKNRESYIIDFYPLTQSQSRSRHPCLFQRIVDRVKPERDQNPVEERRRNWWLFTRPIPKLREALARIQRFIAVPRTAKFFTFQFLQSNTVVDTTIVAIASDDSFVLGVLSSRVHQAWALSSGGRLEDRPRYQHQETFKKFPFPDAENATQERIRALGEQLDAHRKRQQALHPELTMTGMYNVLEKLKVGRQSSGGQGRGTASSDEKNVAAEQKGKSAGGKVVEIEPRPRRDSRPTLTAKEKVIHEQGLVSVLLEIHDELDRAVADAYGWPHDLTDEEILERLVQLNHQRAAEEAAGQVRWLRPEFQAPGRVHEMHQGELEIDDTKPAKPPAAKKKKIAFPKPLPERIRAIRTALAEEPAAVGSAALAKRFSRAKKDTVEELLETLVAVGQARRTDDGRYVA